MIITRSDGEIEGEDAVIVLAAAALLYVQFIITSYKVTFPFYPARGKDPNIQTVALRSTMHEG